MTTTVFNGHTFHIGDLVWQQMWQPFEPMKTHKYGPRRLMKLAGIVPDRNGPGIDRWWLVDPDRPNDESRMSWVESDWCDLEPASEDLGMLF